MERVILWTILAAGVGCVGVGIFFALNAFVVTIGDSDFWMWGLPGAFCLAGGGAVIKMGIQGLRVPPKLDTR